jgi:alpha-beta hydrolase superfamily lysophospholipase
MKILRRVTRIAFFVMLVTVLLSYVAGCALGTGALHPQRLVLSPDSIARADQAFSQVSAARADFVVRPPDGTALRGWKVRPAQPNWDWVLLFHGIADNRVGTLSYAKMLLHHGYSVVMMDARAHGESEGPIATYGWKERDDTRVVVDELLVTESPHCLFALGESMGAAVALQSAGIEPRIEGVVAESSFRNLREVTYDYAGLHWSPLLGKTLFRPASMAALPRMEKEGGFRAGDVSPERAVATRAFPVLLICDGGDKTIPCRHSEAIYTAAIGPKSLWRVRGASHTGAYGAQPVEFERRILAFFEEIHSAKRLTQ